MFIPARDTGDADIEPIPRYAPRQRTKPNDKRDDIRHRSKALRRSGASLGYRAAAKDHAAKSVRTRFQRSAGRLLGIFSAHPLSDISYTYARGRSFSATREPPHSAADDNVRKGA